MTIALAPATASAGSQNPDPISVVQIALSSTSLGLSIGAMAAMDNQDLPACVTIGVLKPSFDAAYTVVRDRASSMPAVNANICSCLSFAADLPPAVLEERVASLVDSLVGSTLRTIESAIGASGSMPCRDEVILSGVLDYLTGVTGAILAELSEPDGAVSIALVRFNDARCETAPASMASPPRNEDGPLICRRR